MKMSVVFRVTSIAGLAYALVRGMISVGFAGDSTVNPDTLPMFGQPKIARSDAQKASDEIFIRDNVLRYKTKQAASNAYAALGWNAVRGKELDSAMLRFNQAWLLNAKNYNPFWGFGAVLTAKGHLSEAIDQLEVARDLIDDPTQRPALLCDLGAVHSEFAARLPAERQLERAQRFVVANSRFTESLENDPNFAHAWREWAISLYEQERYSEAWVKVKRARELRAEPFPPEFLKKLSAKMAEPK
jgi:tetratricopeptide (TPR) repeat protein